MSAEERVVVTGAAGFIGRWVVRELLDRGYEVYGIDDLSNGQMENVEAFSDVERFTFQRGDVTDPGTVSEAFDRRTISCVHLAAEIDVQESLERPDDHFETNVVGTQNVLEAARRTSTPLTLVGTCMVYDVADSKDGIGENHPLKPASPYAGSKLAGEEMALSYYRAYDLPVRVLRPFNTYGPFQKTGMAGGVVSIFVNRDIRGDPIRVFGDGTQTRDFLYVTDCARFIVEATFSDAAVGEVINAGTGSDIAIKDLATRIAGEGTPVKFVEHHHPQSEIEKLVCDPTKAAELLGWEPKIPLDEGIDYLREWLATCKDDE